MRISKRLLLVAVILVSSTLAAADPIDDLRSAFLRPPDDARIMMRWWWFGPAVEKAQLEREMRLMKEGGIGGFEVQPVYPVVLDDANIKTLPFLSDGFIDALRFTSDKSRELGLRFDLTLGSGWPFGGPMVSVEHAAGRLRYERVKVTTGMGFVKVPSTGAGEKLLAVFQAQPRGNTFEDSVIELTEIKDGHVFLHPMANADPQEVLFFIAGRTGMQVKRPAVGSEGFVLDHMNRAATDGYLKAVGDRLLQAFGSNPPYSVFCDSLEVYNSDWSSDFLEEFKKRRGYDLKHRLPALVNDMGPQTKALRRDWGLTLYELLNERFLAPMQEWSKRNGTKFRVQDYGVPAAAISSNSYADIPDGEGAQWKVVRAARWASSASHLYSRPIASSETWTWLHSPSFRATPLDVKAEADVHFLQGINQLIGHGWPYTAPGVEYPGWRFYAAGVFNDKNPWWNVMPDLAKYLQRVSYLMRQGQPANDVALYLPNDDGWASMVPGNPHLIEVLREHVGPNLMPAIFEAGYNLDFFDDQSFKQVGRVENGSLVLGQNKYKIIILPAVETIPLETYRKFEEFARSGGILVATRRTPHQLPGFLATQKNHDEIAAISKRLFEGGSAHFVADEKGQLRGTLNRLLQPDMGLATSNPDIGFIHRRTSDADIYFIANTGNSPQQVKASFRVSRDLAEWWNSFDGSVRPFRLVKGETAPSVELHLEPYESRVLVFSQIKKAASVIGIGNRPDPPGPMNLSAGWTVSVGKNSPRQWDQLRSWADDEATRYYSGVATYEKEIDVPATFKASGLNVYLDFGKGTPITPIVMRNGMRAWLDAPIRDAAVVYINDKRIGSVWCAPYTIAVGEALRPGPNKIRIEVANTAMNYMAGHSLPDYRLLNLRYGERFQPQDMDKIQALPSGLLGPIKLIASN
jgi:hypothetical protein